MECYVVWNTLTNNLLYNLSVSKQMDETLVAYVNCHAHWNVLPFWASRDHFKFHDENNMWTIEGETRAERTSQRGEDPTRIAKGRDSEDEKMPQ